MDEFSMVDETDTQTTSEDLSRSTMVLEKWGWIMFECGIENLTVKGNLRSEILEVQGHVTPGSLCLQHCRISILE